MNAKEKHVQVCARVPSSWLRRAEALRSSFRLIGITRTDVFRMAMAEGLEKLERDAQRPTLQSFVSAVPVADCANWGCESLGGHHFQCAGSR